MEILPPLDPVVAMDVLFAILIPKPPPTPVIFMLPVLDDRAVE